MKLRYDLHLHSCLSPCGDADMTPYNLVRMAQLLELDVIALTDHNSTGNCRSAMAVGRKAGITVIPGMELCTSEEIHVVCLFPDIDQAEVFGGKVALTLLPVKNKPAVFGDQLYMDDCDKVLSSEEILLVTASGISIEEVRGLCEGCGGFSFPAHIDRSSFSILSSLGTFPGHLGFTCAEMTPGGDLAALREKHAVLKGLRILRSSDAHYLENMTQAADVLEAEENTAQAVLRALKGIGK